MQNATVRALEAGKIFFKGNALSGSKYKKSQVESPHEGAVHLLVFQPAAPAAHPREVSLLTCGQDGRAKVWSGGEASWNCRLCIGIYVT